MTAFSHLKLHNGCQSSCHNCISLRTTGDVRTGLRSFPMSARMPLPSPYLLPVPTVATAQAASRVPTSAHCSVGTHVGGELCEPNGMNGHVLKSGSLVGPLGSLISMYSNFNATCGRQECTPQYINEHLFYKTSRGASIAHR